MIITVTCNPAIDKTISENETMFNVGGKGINVSKVLKQLGCPSLCTGFLGKDNGRMITDVLDAMGIEHHFIEIEGKVRTNTKKIANGELIEENEKGPDVSKEDLDKLFAYLGTVENQTIVISGSAPKNLSDDLYYRMVKLVKDKGNYVVLDCDGERLKQALKANPDVIKPNKDEICGLFGFEYEEKEAIKRCKELGIDTIVLSLGGEGALFISKETYKAKAVKVNFVSPVGAGDSMVAAMAYGKEMDLSYVDTMKLAMSCASASVEMEGSNPPDKGKIEAFLDKIELQKLD